MDLMKSILGSLVLWRGSCLNLASCPAAGTTPVGCREAEIPLPGGNVDLAAWPVHDHGKGARLLYLILLNARLFLVNVKILQLL